MKRLIYTVSILSGTSLLMYSCSKGGGNYSVADHTTGIANVVRSWSGTANGFVQGDTIIPPATASVPWPKAYSRTITDTSFAVQKINGFAVAVLGYTLNYLTTDSTVNHLVEFDTTLSGSSLSFLKYYYISDSMSFEFHWISGYNSAANQYYQTNYYLHTNHT